MVGGGVCCDGSVVMVGGGDDVGINWVDGNLGVWFWCHVCSYDGMGIIMVSGGDGVSVGISGLMIISFYVG